MKKTALVIVVLIIAIYSYAEDKHGNSVNPKTINSQKDTLPEKPGISLYSEFLGKGFFSINADFSINFNHRFSFGLTWLDYDFMDYENYHVGKNGAPTAGLMYYYLIGKKTSFLELGGGFSLYHRIDLDYDNDSPLSLHGVIGYRYQKKNGLLIRAGFTPFYRPRVWFLPLLGVSFGYSW